MFKFEDTTVALLVERLSNTSWVAWDREGDKPAIFTYQGQRSELSIEFHRDGTCNAGMALKWDGKWEIRDCIGHPKLFLLFGNRDDDLMITAKMIDNGKMMLNRECYKETPNTAANNLTESSSGGTRQIALDLFREWLTSSVSLPKDG